MGIVFNIKKQTVSHPANYVILMKINGTMNPTFHRHLHIGYYPYYRGIDKMRGEVQSPTAPYELYDYKALYTVWR
jgi:hypothetical protein